MVCFLLPFPVVYIKIVRVFLRVFMPSQIPKRAHQSFKPNFEYNTRYQLTYCYGPHPSPLMFVVVEIIPIGEQPVPILGWSSIGQIQLVPHACDSVHLQVQIFHVRTKSGEGSSITLVGLQRKILRKQKCSKVDTCIKRILP